MIGTVSTRAVVFSITYLGDLVLATLAFDALTKRFGAPIDVVTAPTPAPLLANDPRIRCVRTVTSVHPVGWRLQVGRELLRARRQRSQVVNLEVFAPRWRFLRALCRIAGTPSVDLDLTGLLRNQAAAARGDHATLSHHSLFYARAIGLSEGEPPPPRLFIPEQARTAMRARLRALSASSPLDLIVLHPGASLAAKRPPLSLLAATIRGLATVSRLLVIAVGSATERPLTESLVEQLPGYRVSSWAGQLGVLELAALIEQSRLFVGGDSGPLKVAEAVGARTLSFWGPTCPRLLGPRGPGHRMLQFTTSGAEAGAAALQLLESA